jgi:hypothetical protein
LFGGDCETDGDVDPGRIGTGTAANDPSEQVSWQPSMVDWIAIVLRVVLSPTAFFVFGFCFWGIESDGNKQTMQRETNEP